MPPRTHSLLSPSKSSMWLYCHAAAKLNDVEQETNEAAEYGSECHLLGERYIKEALKLDDFESEENLSIHDLKQSLPHYDEEMDEIASGYADYVLSVINFERSRTGKEPLVVIEQLLDMDFAPDTSGTLDCGIISGDTLIVIDLKTGRLKVEAEKNTQLSIYAIAFYKKFGKLYPIKNVRLNIYQPRVFNYPEYESTLDDLLKWEREVLIPNAILALSENPEAVSGPYCKYCVVKDKCKKRMESNMNFINPAKNFEILTDAEIEAILPRVIELAEYAKNLKEYALSKAKQGYKWKGFKLVERETKNTYTDPDALVAELKERNLLAYIKEQKPKPIGVTELKKKLKGTDDYDLITKYVFKPKGDLDLVPESEKGDEVIIEKEGEQDA